MLGRTVSIGGFLILATLGKAGAIAYGPAAPNGGPPTWTSHTPMAAASGSIGNGGFETGTFSEWTVSDEVGGFSGTWFINAGTSSPVSFFPIPSPPEGAFDATTDQRGAGSHILSRAITLDNSPQHTVSLIYSVNNRAGAYFTPASLDALGPFENQQFRIDIMKPTAPIESVAPGDILLTLFATQVGDPLTIPPTTLQADVSQFAGQTIRLRFAEVDNQFFFQAGVDAVEVTGTVTTAAPLLGSVGLAIAVGLLLFVGGFRVRQKRATWSGH